MDDRKLYRVALFQKRIQWVILLMVLVMAAALVLAIKEPDPQEAAQYFFFFPYLVLGPISLYFTVNLIMALDVSPKGLHIVIYLFLLFVGKLSILYLLFLMTRSNKALKEAGYEVGLLGVPANILTMLREKSSQASIA